MAAGESSTRPRETGKFRSQRIQIDYYRHRGGLYYFKWILSGIALLMSGGYAAYALTSNSASRHLSTGPVAQVHASFENDCGQCHQDYTPLGTDSFQLDPAASLSHLESACQKCHKVGNHYREVLSADWKVVDQNCALCHSDHQGRDFNLVAVSDAACTQCHSQLSSVCSSNHQPRVGNQVTQFTKEKHGEFTSLMQGDRGVVKFDHGQHMLAGQVNAGEKGGLTLAMLEPSRREQYRQPGQSDDALVSMNCASCHEFDGNPDPTSILSGDEELGRYIAPISFDEHCSACHSMNPSGRGDDTLPLPHAAPWAEISLLLETKINGSILTGKMRKSGDDSQQVPRPGDGLGTPSIDTLAASASTVDAAVALVRTQCTKCHDDETITDEAIAKFGASTAEPLIPPRWFKFGLYDHAAHRKMDCRYCHEAAYPVDGAKPSEALDQNSVMIAGIDSCTGCHRKINEPTPSSLTGAAEKLIGGQSTWASDSCTTCHRYHTPQSDLVHMGGLQTGEAQP